MVPHAEDRPCPMWRWNKGMAHDAVVQQSLPKGAPEWVRPLRGPAPQGR